MFEVMQVEHQYVRVAQEPLLALPAAEQKMMNSQNEIEDLLVDPCVDHIQENVVLASLDSA